MIKVPENVTLQFSGNYQTSLLLCRHTARIHLTLGFHDKFQGLARTVCTHRIFVITLPKIPCIHRICMALANPTHF